MHILMLLWGNFPPDIRVEKEAMALLSAGHKVSLLCTGPTSSPKRETYMGINVFRILLDAHFLIQRSCSITFYISHVHLAFKYYIEKIRQSEQIDALHVHDLPLAKTALIFKKFNIPVVLDFHENFPAALASNTVRKNILQNIKHYVFLNKNIWKKYELCSVQRCDKVIIVVDEAIQRFPALLHSKFVIVSNTESHNTFKQPVDYKNISDRSILTASYIGGFGPHRGIDTIARAIPIITAQLPNFHLQLVGANNEYSRFIESILERNGGKNYATITGWQPTAKMPQYFAAADVILIPHNVSEHTNTTVPHKLFQAMLMQKPVIVSDCTPLQRIVNETGCGLVFHADDSNDFAETILHFFANPEIATQCAANGYKAATGKYSWECDAERLVDLYNSI